LEQSNPLSRRFGARPCNSHELSRVLPVSLSIDFVLY